MDTICIAGKTFQFTEQGPIGLLKGKKAVHIQTSGGVWSKGPASAMDFSSRYLHALLGFMGVTDVESIFAEGMALYPEKTETIFSDVVLRAREVAERFAG
ncbi:FMN-dependent NADH-azoreductase [Desmospora profundinema]|uniref:FMN-dependent NADH-azoreductase n=1 Tax=Desmospora profundinema TaxID=1571184 RepID=A0ABU1IPZ5_9BACL|nr:NAD(P)H-dependent oxidoreductase [Desmospora profundinema]MDR6226871.1 FMN-dependent NADH-azoreductase [Desmospora profundinema]